MISMFSTSMAYPRKRVVKIIEDQSTNILDHLVKFMVTDITNENTDKENFLECQKETVNKKSENKQRCLFS